MCKRYDIDRVSIIATKNMGKEKKFIVKPIEPINASKYMIV